MAIPMPDQAMSWLPRLVPLPAPFCYRGRHERLNVGLGLRLSQGAHLSDFPRAAAWVSGFSLFEFSHLPLIFFL
jgi:hypothetical protein